MSQFKNPDEVLSYLLEHGVKQTVWVLQNEKKGEKLLTREIAFLLYRVRELLNPLALGQILSSEKNSELLSFYAQEFNFKNKKFVPALQEFLGEGGFIVPDGAEDMAVFSEAFARQYGLDNPNSPILADLAVLIQTVMTLNTCLEHPEAGMDLLKDDFIEILTATPNSQISQLDNAIKKNEEKIETLNAKPYTSMTKDIYSEVVEKRQKKNLTDAEKEILKKKAIQVMNSKKTELEGLKKHIEHTKAEIEEIKTQLNEVYDMVEKAPIKFFKKEKINAVDLKKELTKLGLTEKYIAKILSPHQEPKTRNNYTPFAKNAGGVSSPETEPQQENTSINHTKKSKKNK